MKGQVLSVIQETEILGKRIEVYGNIEYPLFLSSDVANWIEYSSSNGKLKTSQMMKMCDEEEKGIYNVATLGGIQEKWFVTEDGLYEICMQSRKPIAKALRKEIKQYLRSIRLTGAAIQEGREEEMISKYFPSFSKETQAEMVNDIIRQNKMLKQFYDDVINTEGLMDMNTVAKELSIGEYKLFAFLRSKKIFFYNKENVNVPYERFRKEGKFKVKETPCHDGVYRSVTYATKKGLDYIRKQLHKAGYYDVNVA